MQILLQLAGFLAQTPRTNKDERDDNETAASATNEKCGLAPSVKRQKHRMDVSKLMISEIRALIIYYLMTEISKGNEEVVGGISAVLMEKSPRVVFVISAVRIAPPAVTEAGSDEDAEEEKNTNKEVE
jgi:hypothetical protein